MAGEQEWNVTAQPPYTLSPSLQLTSRDVLPAHEVKFLLDELQAQQVAAELRSALIPDPHADPQATDGGYSTTTVYCDTPEFDLYHRRGGHARRKFRLRRYGCSESVYLERKSKQGTRVRKRRTCIPLTDLERLEQPPSELCWDADWFHRRVACRRLSPVLAVMYDRAAFIGTSDDGPLRLTFDRAVRCQPVDSWEVRPFCGGHSILADLVICEFKFLGPMPGLFKRVIASQQLSPASASKYRLCLQALGVMNPTETT